MKSCHSALRSCLRFKEAQIKSDQNNNHVIKPMMKPRQETKAKKGKEEQIEQGNIDKNKKTRKK